MFELQKIEAKHKFYGLLFGLLALLIISYQFSIRHTTILYQAYTANQLALASAETAPAQIREYQTRLRKLTTNNQNNTYNRSQLFETVNTFCREHQIKLSYFPPEVIRTQNDYQIITNQMEVEGKYVDMVKLAYELEQVQRVGHLASIHFEQKKDLRTRKKYLQGSLYLQHLLQKTD